MKFVSLNNQPCEARITLANINSNKLLCFLFTVSVKGTIRSDITFGN